MIQVAVVVESSLVSDANHLFGVIGYREEDNRTFGGPTHTDGEKEYSLAGGLLGKEVVERLTGETLERPEWSVDMAGAKRARERLEVWEEEGEVVGDFVVFIGQGLSEAASTLGLVPLPIFEEEEGDIPA